MDRSVEGIGRALTLRPKRALVERLELRVLFAATSLDTTFGSGAGKVITDINGGTDYGNAVAVQSNGKIVVAGTSGQIALARYNVDGHLDDGGAQDITTGDQFGTNGKVVTTPVDSIASAATSIVIQPDGKIVVGGWETDTNSYGTNTFFTVVRYTTSGALDTTFGPSHSGLASTGFGTADDVLVATAAAIALQPDGKILLAGTAGGDFALARFTATGFLDPTFNGGQVVTDFGGNDTAAAVAVQGDGDIVAVGTTSVAGGHNQFALARYQPNGTLDGNFSADGEVTTGYTDPRYSQTFGMVANGVVIQPDGKIVVSGTIEGGVIGQGWVLGLGTAVLVRYNVNGSLDSTFAGGVFLEDPAPLPGFDFFNFDGPTYEFDAYAFQLALQRDGTIDVSCAGPGYGESDNSEWLEFAVAQVTKNGITSQIGLFDFNNLTGDAATSAYAPAIALAPNGNIVLAGSAANGGGGENFAVARLVGSPTNAYGSISGQVLNAKDGSPLADRQVYIDSINNNSFDATEQSCLTDSKGNYKLDGLAAGTYKVRVVAGAAITQTLPINNGSCTITLPSGQSATGKNFGLKLPGTQSLSNIISGVVFNDINANGVLDIAGPADYGLSGRRIYIDKTKAGHFVTGDPTATTDARGDYQFGILADGTYRVRMDVPSGCRRTTPLSGYYDVTLKAGPVGGKNFGITKNILISGSAFNDANGNKTRDTINGVQEAGLSGWTVYIDANKNGKLDANETLTLTDSKGNWSFPTLAASSSPYVIRILPTPKWSLTTPAGGYLSVTLTATGSSKTGLLFGEKKIA